MSVFLQACVLIFCFILGIVVGAHFSIGDSESSYKLLIALSEEAIKLAKRDKSLAVSDLIRCSNEIDNLIAKCRKDPSAYSSDLNRLIELNSTLKLLIHSND